MKLIMGIFFTIIVGYQIVKFIQVLIKMKKNVILPIGDQEIASIRKFPDRIVSPPTLAGQKRGIFYYVLMLFFMLVFLVGLTFSDLNLFLYLYILLPLFYVRNMLNVFAVMEEGVLVGGRFLNWNRINYYQFKRIDINHKFYGHSSEVNKNGYELQLKSWLFSANCIVTSGEMKEKLTKILHEHGVNEREHKLSLKNTEKNGV